jgi:GNAT superfamily N-acetyltransferase
MDFQYEPADNQTGISIRPATPDDVGLVRRFINDLAEYERLAHESVATEDDLRNALFGERPFAEVIIGYYNNEPAGFALFFHNFSTFVGKPGIYLEDLFVRPELRGNGIGKALLAHLAKLAVERGCGRLEWAVLDWNEPSIGFYRGLGALPMNEWTVFRMTGESLAALASAGGAPAHT